MKQQSADARFAAWMAGIEARGLAELSFPEVSRALRALSATYVERRRRIAEGAVFDGRGKRAAFALFYAPLHYLLVREIVAALPDARPRRATIVDLGCGTGAASAAWASQAAPPAPRVLGIDRHPWAVEEAGRTYRAFGLSFQTRCADIARLSRLPSPADMVAAFALNELPEAVRDELLTTLVDRARRGDRVLVVEPLARFVAPWWGAWAAAFQAAGGRADEWRVRVDLPPLVRKLDRAAGLDHAELTGRSLWLGSRHG